VLSFWRQDDPAEWPPVRGDIREVAIDDLEYRVDEVILAAEHAWSHQSALATVEFLLPRTLLHLPVHRWRKEHHSGEPRPLFYDYQLSLRSLERMQSKHWHRSWHVRWDSMLKNPSADRVHPFDPAELGDRSIEDILSDPQWIGLVMTEPPPSEPGHGIDTDQLLAALRAGLPLIFWHPEAKPDDLREVVKWLGAGERGLIDLLTRRKAASSLTAVPFNNDLIRNLVVMWDDPKRVVALDQPSIPSPR